MSVCVCVCERECVYARERVECTHVCIHGLIQFITYLSLAKIEPVSAKGDVSFTWEERREEGQTITAVSIQCTTRTGSSHKINNISHELHIPVSVCLPSHCLGTHTL